MILLKNIFVILKIFDINFNCGGIFMKKVVVIIGVSDGIGYEIVIYLVSKGMIVVLLFWNKIKLESVRKKIYIMGGEVIVIFVDIFKVKEVE